MLPRPHGAPPERKFDRWPGYKHLAAPRPNLIYYGAEANATSVIKSPPCSLSLKVNCTDLTALRFTPLKALNGTRTVFKTTLGTARTSPGG